MNHLLIYKVIHGNIWYQPVIGGSCCRWVPIIHIQTYTRCIWVVYGFTHLNLGTGRADAGNTHLNYTHYTQLRASDILRGLVA